MKKVYLVDTNTFIAPYQTYYSFDFAPNFWHSMEARINDGSIVILDKVYNELADGEDKLSDWFRGLETPNIIEYRNQAIILKYGEILAHIQTSGLYKPKALAEWSNARIADPWLIACACVHGYTIVTFEKPIGNLSKASPSAHPKIPDVAKAFGVECIDLYDMMRALPLNI